MLLLLALVFLAVPIVEIWVLIEVGSRLGYLETIALMILVSAVGAWLTRHEGFVVLRRLRARLEGGELPGDELIDGALVLGAGLLLLTPGFVTDAVGLLVLFPATRAPVRAYVRRRLRLSVVYQRFDGSGRRRPPDDVIDV